MKLPDLLATRRGRFSAFFFLYVTEGLPLGFTATAVATQMRRQGLGPSEIGVFVGTLYLPWAWKWVMGLGAAWAEIRGYCIAAVKAFVGSRAALVGAVVAILPAGAYSLSLALQSNLAVELGLSDRKIALLALLSTVISAVGCVAGGYLSDRFGRKRMLAIYLVGTTIPVAALGWVMDRHGWIMPIDPRLPDRPVPADVIIVAFWAANIVYAIFQGLMYGTRTALFMDICTPAVAATQFTAYMAMLNLVIWYSATWQGFCIEAWGYPITLGMDALAGLACLPLLPLMSRDRDT